MKEMLLAQQQASDQWAFYQAKNIREHFYAAKAAVGTGPAGKGDPEARGKQRYAKMLKKTEVEEAATTSKSKKSRRKPNTWNTSGRSTAPRTLFEYAEVLLQIAIVMSSIAILAHSRLMFGFSLVSATLGAPLAANGFLMIVHLPFFGH